MHENERQQYLSIAAEIYAEAGTKSILRIAGYSMEPMLLEGETILVDHAHKDLRSGDIGVFKMDGLIVVHRVLFKQIKGGGIYYRTKGDWMFPIDPPVEQDSVAGKVSAFTRKGKQYDLNAPAARLYARAVALYSFGIALDGKVAFLLDRFLSFIMGRREATGRGIGKEEVRFFRRLILSFDRVLQKFFHSIFFRLFNRASDGALTI